MNPLILDTDGGVDDAQALLMLIANGRPPDAITTVFGNVGLDAATRNILAVLAVAGADIPVHTGAARPLLAERIEATEIHGSDGLGGAPRPERTAEPASLDAVGFLIGTLRSAAAADAAVDLLFIGPLTNLALALRLDPGIAAGIGQLTIMGGTLNGRGNVTPAAEFNIYADPEAAAIVFAAGLDIVLVPWEPCTSHRLDGAVVEALFAQIGGSTLKDFAEALAGHARRTNIGYGNGDILRFVDPLAAAVVLAPEVVTKALLASVAVALAPGLTRGMTLVDPSGRLGGRKVRVVEDADMVQLTAMFLRGMG